ncbi:PLP-dependent transferase [Paenibacillus graminis]|uniref:PLP-dependent transferase n=1 Tax=Paenibacillus graminis TaxID=189425 RepID=UPI002DB925C2|nr:PLP-dependent transferase [Paenibacillus graminis]MEC0167293.1 PLP-dependent transferase [Paenibacillus graminis]
MGALRSLAADKGSSDTPSPHGRPPNALAAARFLSEHPAVAKVNHPGLPSHPQHELASTQFKGYSGLFSFELKDSGYEEIRQMVNKLQLIRIGVSWGSAESQIISPNYGYNQQDLKHL